MDAYLLLDLLYDELLKYQIFNVHLFRMIILHCHNEEERKYVDKTLNILKQRYA